MTPPPFAGKFHHTSLFPADDDAEGKMIHVKVDDEKQLCASTGPTCVVIVVHKKDKLIRKNDFIFNKRKISVRKKD